MSHDLTPVAPEQDLFTHSVTPLSAVAYGYHVIMCYIICCVSTYNKFCKCERDLFPIFQVVPGDEATDNSVMLVVQGDKTGSTVTQDNHTMFRSVGQYGAMQNSY